MSNRKLQICLLMLLFLMPPIAAYVLFFSDFRPAVGVNYGELIEPVRPMGEADLETLGGQGFKLSELHQKWTLLYVGGPVCDQICERNLYKIHQVRLAQGKNIDRVRSVYVLPQGAARDAVSKIGEVYPSLLILLAKPEEYSKILERFMGGTTEQQTVFVVDPIGNVMMFYHAEADPSGMRKDLKRLLKVSQIG